MMKKIKLIVALCLLCFLCACGKNEKRVDVKEYVIPGEIMFLPEDDKETKEHIVANMKGQQSLEDVYLNDDEDVIMVMTEEQCRASLSNSEMLIKEMMDLYVGEKAKYSINAERNVVELYVDTKETLGDGFYQSKIYNILDTLFLCQILSDVDITDAKVEVKINYMDTDTSEVLTYTIDDMP